jgi:uncharacterized protein YraI
MKRTPFVLLAAVTAAVGVAVPAQAAPSVAATVADTGGLPLMVRSGPGTGYGVVGQLDEGTSVTVECQSDGTVVEGNGVWDYLPAYGGYAADRYLATPGYDGRHPSLPSCDDATDGVRDRIVQVARGELGNTDKSRYGAPWNHEWCQYFVNWVWANAGVPDMFSANGFTGDFYWWAADRGLLRDGTSGIQVGDAVLFGTGPSSPSTSLHVGIVVAVHGDGSIESIDGNYADAVARVGPYFPGSATTHEPGDVYAVVSPE